MNTLPIETENDTLIALKLSIQILYTQSNTKEWVLREFIDYLPDGFWEIFFEAVRCYEC
jgi:hypothetical protein